VRLDVYASHKEVIGQLDKSIRRLELPAQLLYLLFSFCQMKGNVKLHLLGPALQKRPCVVCMRVGVCVGE